MRSALGKGRGRNRAALNTVNTVMAAPMPAANVRIAATVNEVQVWDLVNLSEMSHPFHLHGFFFQVLSRDGVAVASPTWEDTLELHGEERVRIAFRPDDRPGMWMFHCHILEHAHGGMMGMLELTR